MLMVVVVVGLLFVFGDGGLSYAPAGGVICMLVVSAELSAQTYVVKAVSSQPQVLGCRV